MAAAPLRQDEEGALETLRALDILDTEPEAEFDALVSAAALVCEVPISLMTLLDEKRQWFKARVGMDDLRETDRDAAFCAHAVLDDALFEVPDARLDDRFADNPFVTPQAGIRFYAGMPMRLASGHRVGVLCVIDRQPRQLSDHQRAVLRQLGLAAARLLEGRLAVRAARESAALAAASETRFRTLSEGAPVGVFHAEADGSYTYVNPIWREIHGLEPARSLDRAWSDAIHPIDRAAVLARWQAAADAGRPFDAEYRIRGRGFAVDATEVRSLAQRSAAAAKEIKTLIIDSVERVEQGTLLVDKAGTTMAEVVGSIRRVSDIVGEISAASLEQSTGVAQVGEAVTQMDQVTQQNAALVEERAAAAESLKLQSEQLVKAVSAFRLGQEAGAPAFAQRPSLQSMQTPAASQAQTLRSGRAVNVASRTPRPAPAPVGNERWQAF